MKRKEKSPTIEEAVARIAALTEDTWSRFSPREKTERLHKAKQFIALVKKKERSLIPHYN
jgi:hypothetical protein